MENVEIARMLYEYAGLIDIQGESPFRVRAYRKAAQTLEGMSRPVAQLVEEGEDLTQLPGIGSSMAAHMRYGIDQARRAWLEKRHVMSDLKKPSPRPSPRCRGATTMPRLIQRHYPRDLEISSRGRIDHRIHFRQKAIDGR